MTLQDTGARKEFESGAVREVYEGKGRMDLLDLECLARLFSGDSIILSILDFFNNKDPEHLLDAIKTFISTRYEGSTATAMIELSKQFEDGARKYPPNNWRRGINLHCYIDSALRHYMKFLRGDIDEPHDRAFLWNLMCGRWTFLNRPECDDIERTGSEK
jgi:hypothetical protein